MDMNQEDNFSANIPMENEQDQEDVVKKEDYTIFRGIQSIVCIAILIATLLTLWNPRKVFKTPNIYDLFQSEATLETYDDNLLLADDSRIRIGILAGHWQNNTGEVCADGIIEVDINYNIASRIKLNLEEKNFQVNLFPEFDLELLNYEADALVAVYSGSCLQSPPPPSGFKIGTSLTAKNPEEVNNLAVCLAENYQNYTQLPFSYEIINPDHSSYHIFRDIHPNTPAVLIEIGALSTDRDLITNRSNSIAEGIAAGITCYIEKASGNNE
jgi:N-acetylmuramoyl-L-alanine amidase